MRASDGVSQWNIDVRLRLVISYVLERRNSWKKLEEMTDIAAERWRQWNLGNIKTSAEMIEVVCKTWPQYAFWLVTGLSDPHFGHSAPFSSRLGFPFATATNAELHENTDDYFGSSLKAMHQLWVAKGLPEDVLPRQLAAELEDGESIALNGFLAKIYLGEDAHAVISSDLSKQLQLRLEDVIQELRDSFSWVDKYIDYQREAEKNLEVKLASLEAELVATARATSTSKKAPSVKPKRKPSR